MGARVRQLRIERGMTQGQLASDDFSSGFISLLETGRTRASLRAAEILARRLGVAVSELLASRQESSATAELTLLQAEAALSKGDAAGARALAERAAKSVHGLDRARAARARGRALVALGKGQEALAVLDGAAREFRALGKRDLAARTLFDLAMAHRALDATGEALNLAAQCENALVAGDLIDRSLELQVLLFLANGFLRIGDITAANARAERALRLAEDVADSRTLAELYAGLAVTRQEQGDSEAAVTYTRRSLELYERVGDERAVAEAWNTSAWVFIQRGDLKRAATVIDRAAELANETKHEELAALILATRAELALAQGKPAEAVTLAEASAAHPHVSRYGRAHAVLLRAQALSARKAPLPMLRRAFGDALKAAASQPRSFRARVHEAFGTTLAARGDSKAGLEHTRVALELTKPGRP